MQERSHSREPVLEAGDLAGVRFVVALEHLVAAAYP